MCTDQLNVIRGNIRYLQDVPQTLEANLADIDQIFGAHLADLDQTFEAILGDLCCSSFERKLDEAEDTKSENNPEVAVLMNDLSIKP
jgi:hypothetical protein